MLFIVNHSAKWYENAGLTRIKRNPRREPWKVSRSQPLLQPLPKIRHRAVTDLLDWETSHCRQGSRRLLGESHRPT